METHYDLHDLSADLLCSSLQRILSCHHQLTADLLAHLAEVDARKLYLDHACSSMFNYLVTRLHMSEPTTYKRLEAARTARRFPVIFELVAAGSLHLTGIVLLAPKLTEENHQELLAASVKKSTCSPSAAICQCPFGQAPVDSATPRRVTRGTSLASTCGRDEPSSGTL